MKEPRRGGVGARQRRAMAPSGAGWSVSEVFEENRRSGSQGVPGERSAPVSNVYEKRENVTVLSFLVAGVGHDPTTSGL